MSRQILGLLYCFYLLLALVGCGGGEKSQSPALTPTFGSYSPTSDGFTVQIRNFDPSFTWSATASDSGSASVNNSGLVRVTGLGPLTGATVTVSTSKANTRNGSASTSGISGILFTNVLPVPSTSTTIDEPGIGQWVQDVYVDGTTIYAALGLGGDGLFKSTDNGVTYTRLSGISSGTQIYRVFVDAETIYATSYSNGLLVSRDGGNSFTRHLSGVSVYSVRVQAGKVYLGTNQGVRIANVSDLNFSNPDTNFTDSVYSVFVTTNKIYAAANTGVWILDLTGAAGFAPTQFSDRNNRADTTVNDVVVEGTSVYAATNEGLSVSTDGGVNFTIHRTFPVAVGDGAAPVYGVTAQSGKVFAATPNGLHVFIHGLSSLTSPFVTLTPAASSGLGSFHINKVFIDSTGKIFVATQYDATTLGNFPRAGGGVSISKVSIPN